MTVLFADVANYTSMSEKLDPEEVHQIMERCFRILMDEIHRFEATITQFTGDGAMALFGAPIAHEDHAQRACYAGLSIQKALAEYGEKVRRERGCLNHHLAGVDSGPDRAEIYDPGACGWGGYRIRNMDPLGPLKFETF